MNNWTRRISLATLSLSLTGCGAAISSCPPITSYTPEQQAQAAIELDAAVQVGAVALPMMIGDYMVLRDQIRACRK